MYDIHNQDEIVEHESNMYVTDKGTMQQHVAENDVMEQHYIRCELLINKCNVAIKAQHATKYMLRDGAFVLRKTC